MTWTRLSATLGTPDYMAPEQIAGRRGDERCDIYAVGLILYEMLTGELPFSGSSALAVMRAKTHEEPRPPAYFVPNLDPALDAIVCKAMARDARGRYQDAKQMLNALLHPHAASETTATEPSRRRPWMPGLVAGLVLAALASLTWLSRP
jgi:serine/threonine-protein kinase